MPNVPVVNSYPAVEFQPGEASSVYHTDQEFTDGAGNSHMYRTYNAQYNTVTGWTTITPGVSDAYATVQNPDGSVHYYWNNNVTSGFSWVGIDNNTIYNAVDFGLAAGGSASDNTGALSSLFMVMATVTGHALSGGMARIPQYNFTVTADSTLTLPDQSIIQGLGTGGQSGTNKGFHFSITDGGLAGPYSFWSVSGSHTSGGIKLRNLSFVWNKAACAQDTVLDLSDYWGFVAEECTFTNCPTAMKFLKVGSGEPLGGAAIRCVIDYGAPPAPTITNVTAILVGGIQTEISGPSEFIGGSLLGATLATCIAIGGGVQNSVHNTFRNLHITGWNYGIDYSDINGAGIGSGTQNNFIDGCQFECFTTCINMTTQSSSDVIFNQTISNCQIAKSPNATNPLPIVFIDSNGGPASNIGPIFLANNLIYSNVQGGSGQVGPPPYNTGVAQLDQYGVQIGLCEYVSIIGGQISQVGTQLGSDGTANICISGNPTTVVIDSVNLSPVYTGTNSGSYTGSTGSAASEYALLITGDPTYVTVNNCPMTGFAGTPVSVMGSPGNLYITNCAGYNDQNTPLNGGAAPLSALSAATCSTRYFGPSVFTWSNPTPVTVHVFGLSYTANSGIIFLPSPYDTFSMSVSPLVFSWIGK